ncbi:MAG: flavin reductase family protein [Roseiflexaceae bacterium]|nr:flavin reductase family protein [Roseiflexaceae bacterium]
MSCFATGVTVISHASAGQVHGMTANAFLSVSLDPPLVLVSLNETARMCRLLVVDQRFGISMLAEDQTTLSNHFAGRSHAHPVVAWRWEADVPLLVGAVAQITARVVATHPVGDHTLFIGQVEQLAHSAGRPLIFYAGSYARLAE